MPALRHLTLGALIVALACTNDLSTSPTPEHALRRTQIPLLVLPERYMRGAVVTARRQWYGIHHRNAELTLYLHGTRVFVDAPADLEEVVYDFEVRGRGALESMNDGIRTVSWMENDTAYTLDVECRSFLDARCRETEFVAALAAELVAR